MQVDDLNAVAERGMEIAAKWRNQFDAVAVDELIAHLGELFFVTNHETEVAHPRRLDTIYFEEGQKLMLAKPQERVALPVVEFFEFEDILVEGNRFVDIVDLDCDVVAAVNLDTHRAPLIPQRWENRRAVIKAYPAARATAWPKV